MVWRASLKSLSMILSIIIAYIWFQPRPAYRMNDAVRHAMLTEIYEVTNPEVSADMLDVARRQHNWLSWEGCVHLHEMAF